MTGLILSLTAAFIDFQPFDPKVFSRLLTPRDRKVVLREITLESLQRIERFGDSLARSTDPKIGPAAYVVAAHAFTISRYILPQPGPDRMFMNPQKAKMIAIGMPGPGTIPSLDHELELLSINMLALAKRLDQVGYSEALDAVPPAPLPNVPVMNYEKVFGARA